MNKPKKCHEKMKRVKVDFKNCGESRQKKGKPSWMESCWQVKIEVNIRFVKQNLKKVKVKEKKNMKVNWRRSSRVESCQVQQSQLWNQLGAKVENSFSSDDSIITNIYIWKNKMSQTNLEARKTQFWQTIDIIIRF